VASFLGRVNVLPLKSDPAGQRGIALEGVWLPFHGAASHQQVMLRPEDIEVSASPGALTRVSHRVFLGDRTHLRVTTPEAGELQVDVARDCDLRVGDGVTLSVDPRALLACGD